MESIDQFWQEQSKWAVDEAARLNPKIPLVGLPAAIQESHYKKMLESRQQTWLELVTGTKQPVISTAGGWLPHSTRMELLEPVARAIWQVQVKSQ
jgi:hypothetical protein